MNIHETRETVLMLALARQSGRLNAGRLMSPEDVVLATSDGKVRPPDVQGWFIAGEMHPEMFRLARCLGIEQQTSQVIRSPGGHRFLVLTQQTSEWQHRFVMRLAGSRVRRLLSDWRQQALRFSLSTAGQDEALIVRCTTAIAGQLPDPGEVPGDDVDLPDLVSEMATLVLLLLMADAMPMNTLPPAHHACVSTVDTSGNPGGMDDTFVFNRLMQFAGLLH